ncbi:hypothetical protein H0H81_002995, partial [Sphagnurus paluster]
MSSDKTITDSTTQYASPGCNGRAQQMKRAPKVDLTKDDTPGAGGYFAYGGMISSRSRRMPPKVASGGRDAPPPAQYVAYGGPGHTGTHDIPPKGFTSADYLSYAGLGCSPRKEITPEVPSAEQEAGLAVSASTVSST